MTSFHNILKSVLLSLVAPTLLSAATLQELQGLVKKDKLEEAYLMAKAMSRAKIGQTDFDFLYGLVSRKAGHPDIALFAFERVLMKNPNDARTLYEHALSLMDLNDLQGAAKDFKSILAFDNIDETLKENAEQLLELVQDALHAQSISTTIATTAQLDLGFNSNVNSGTSGPPIFPIQGSEMQEVFTNLSVSSLLKRQLGKDKAVYFTLSSDNRKNFSTRLWDYNYITGQGGFETSFDQITLRSSFGSEFSFGNYQIDLVTPQFGLDVSYATPESLSSFSIGLLTKFFPDFSENDSFSLPLELSYWTASLFPGVGLSTRLYYTPDFSVHGDPSFTLHSEVGISASSSIEVAASHFLSPMINFIYLNYPLNADEDGTRHDLNITLQIAYEWLLSEHWTLTPSFSYNYGYSTDAGQTYMRFQPQLGLRYEL